VDGPLQVVSDVHTEELDFFSPSTWGVFSLLFPDVHDQLLCFVDVEGEVIFLTPLHQGPHLIPVGCLVILLLAIRPTTVVSSSNLMIELEACVATQSWVNREYRRGLSWRCCCLQYLHHPVRKSKNQQSPEIGDSF
jgi:hypothetical protein